MKFLKINITPAAMIQDFLLKNRHIKDLSYEQLLKKFFLEHYWPSNSLENHLSSLYSWKCNTLISTLNNSKKESEIFFNIWSKSYNQKFETNDFFDRLLFQIIYYEPDILYIQEINQYPKEFTAKIKLILNSVRIIGWNCYPGSEPQLPNLQYSDIVYTCSLGLQDMMLKNGINVEYIHHAFDSKILQNLNCKKKLYDVTFIGGLKNEIHLDRINLLKHLISKGINITIFGECDDLELKQYCKKSVFGLDLYNIYKASKIVIDMHDRNIVYSGNIRMMEVTGVGTFLLADLKKDTAKKFALDKEIAAYKTFDEAVEKINYYLVNEKERESIAKAGQLRTLKDYTYKHSAKKVYQSIADFKKLSAKELYHNLIKRKNTNNYLLSIQVNKFFKAIEELNLDQNIFILYGYGTIGRVIYNQYKSNIEYVADINFNNIELDNIVDPNNIASLNSKNDILISVLGREKNIKIKLLSLGIDEKRIKVIQI